MRRGAVTLLAMASLIAPALARAQVGHRENSLEWLVARAPVVVRATVEKVTRQPDRDDRSSMTVTLRVRETLKGPRRATVAFARNTLSSYRVYDGWRGAGTEALWFLMPQEQAPDAAKARSTARKPLELWEAIRLGPLVAEERGWSSAPPPIFRMDLSVLREPGAILRAAREAARASNANRPVPEHRIDLPRDVMQERIGTSGDVNDLVVPVDRRLEPVARKLITSPGAFLPSAGVVGREGDRAATERVRRAREGLMRREGIRALAYFPSKRNIALLKSLLNDPAIMGVAPPTGQGPIRYEYFVRKAAYAVLRAWDVEMTAPTIEAQPPAP